MLKTAPIRARKRSEDGYMLLAAMFLLFLLALSLTIAAPQMAKSIQRDREVETMERGKQYQRAIQLYYRKFNAYPPSVDALVKTNNIRFLRKRYLDPLTGKDDWKPILFGQNKAPLAMGFFGEPLAGGATVMAGTGPMGGNTTPGAGFGTPGAGGMGSGFGSGIGGGSGTLGGSLFNSGSSSGSAQNPSSGTSGSQGASGTQGGSAGTSATNGQTGSTGSTGSSFMSGQNGQSFGGAGIIGFEPPLAKPSILIYKKKDHYNEWEFTYSPLQDQLKQGAGGNPGIGQPASTLNGQQNGTGAQSPFGGGSFGSPSGGSFGGAGFGSSPTGGGFGSTPTQPTQPQPQPPQQ